MTARARPVLSIMIVCALLAPALMAPAASGGLISIFVEGPTPLLTGTPPTTATVTVPNPSRAVTATVDVSTESTVRQVRVPAPTWAQWSDWASCPTLRESNTSFNGLPLAGVDLVKISTYNGVNWTQPTTVLGCGVLYVAFDTTVAQDPSGAPFLDVTIQVAADADAAAGPSNITLAVQEEPTVGLPFWRQVPLAPSPSGPGAFRATVTHPSLVHSAGREWLQMVLFCPDGGYNLTVDEVSATFGVPDDPYGPALALSPGGGVIWRYRGPDGGDAYFGRSLTDSAGGASQSFASNGLAVDGTTVPLYVAAPAQITSAYFDLLPAPFSEVRSNASNGTNYTVGALSASSAPRNPSVDGFPVYAQPVLGEVYLYGLAAHGVPDAEFTTLSNHYNVCNWTTFERSVAQTFTVTTDGELQSIEVNLADATGYPVGPLVLEVRTVTAGNPDAAVLATGTANLTAARSGGWVNFTLAAPLPVSSGQVLAAVLACPGATAGQRWEWVGHNGATTDPYPEGSAFLSMNQSGTIPWANQTNSDLGFRVRMRLPFNASDAPFLTPAGASGLPVRYDNYSGNLTAWKWLVPGGAIDFLPDFQGGGIWEIQVVDGLSYSVEYQWNATITYTIPPRAVDIGLGNRPAFLSVGQLDRRTVVDFTAELQAAIGGPDVQEIVQGGTTYWFFPIRVHADGPADIVLEAIDIRYGATLSLPDFTGAVNSALNGIPPTGAPANLTLQLIATRGSVRLSNLFMFLSEPPTSPSPVTPLLLVPEASVNITVVDLLQWFQDDTGQFALTYTVDTVNTTAATAAVWRGPIDANLTLTLVDPEFSGNLSVTVRATDTTGLSATRTFPITVIPVDDPPVFLPMPDAVLPATTGTYDLSGYISDPDTHPANLTLGASSLFATLTGYFLNFDYRSAPANFASETLTVWANDGNSNVSATLTVFVNNGGRPVLAFPPSITVVVAHDAALDLDPFAADDVDPDGQLDWAVVLSTGVGATPGNAVVQVGAGRRLNVQPLTPGEVDVNLSVRDRDGNVALGTLRLHVVANQGPFFERLGGARFNLTQDSETRIVLLDYLVDHDDAIGNLTFNVAWTGSGGTAAVEGGDLVIRPSGPAGGTLNVTIVAVDPAGESTAATFTVVIAPATAPSAGLSIVPLLFGLGALLLGSLFYLSYRKGQAARRPSLDKLAREDADIDKGDDGDEGGPPAGSNLPGLEKTDDDRMLDELDKMEAQAALPKIELPPVTIYGVPNAKASTLLLLYRDGRPISWGATSSPTDKDREVAQGLGAALQAWQRDLGEASEKKWATLEAAGKTMVVEARSQLALGAVLNKDADEAIVRVNMRAAMEKIFEAHAEKLKRWDGSRKGLGTVDDVLESLLRR